MKIARSFFLSILFSVSLFALKAQTTTGTPRLQLTTAQVDKINKVNNDLKEDLQKISPNLSPENRAKSINEAVQKKEDAMKKILTVDQYKIYRSGMEEQARKFKDKLSERSKQMQNSGKN
ncbi:hypothetical protein [Ferruginibacter sp.]